MKPYGRNKKVNGSNGTWKKDYHLHNKKHRKIKNWWECICDYETRTTMKLKIKKFIENIG